MQFSWFIGAASITDLILARFTRLWTGRCKLFRSIGWFKIVVKVQGVIIPCSDVNIWKRSIWHLLKIYDVIIGENIAVLIEFNDVFFSGCEGNIKEEILEKSLMIIEGNSGENLKVYKERGMVERFVKLRADSHVVFATNIFLVSLNIWWIFIKF